MTLPPLPEVNYLGDDVSYGYDACDMREYGAACAAAERAWRDTVDDMLTVCHAVASDDPRESINRLIDWHVSVSLDPAVSSAAQALIEQGAAAERERCAQMVAGKPFVDTGGAQARRGPSSVGTWHERSPCGNLMSAMAEALRKHGITG